MKIIMFDIAKIERTPPFIVYAIKNLSDVFVILSIF